jgi:dipeptidyl aminopeptidase/acylaminoacyl peptidase
MPRPSRRSLLAAGVLTVIVLTVMGLRGCSATGPAVATLPLAAPAPTREQSARRGQIYYHRDVELLKILPGEGLVTRIPGMADEGLTGYQTGSDRLSPDATRIAFGRAVVKEINGHYGTFPPNAIHVRSLASPEKTFQLVAMEGAEIHNFFWSPDSARIAFVTWDEKWGSRNWIVDARGGVPREMILPRYSANGQESSLVVTAFRPDGAAFAAADYGFLYLVEMQQSESTWKWSGRKRLTRDERAILPVSCSFSPDGGSVLYVVMESARQSLRMTNVETNDEQTLVEANHFTDLSACWSPDGQRIAFSGGFLNAEGKRAGQSGLYTMSASGPRSEAEPVLEEFHPPEILRLRLVGWH